MLTYIVSILCIVFDILCCKMFYETFERRRYIGNGFINIVQIFLLCFAEVLSSYFLISNFVVRQLVNIITISIIMCWHMIIDYKKSVFMAILYENLLLSAGYISFFINTKLVSSKNRILQHYGVEEMQAAILGNIILFACVLFIRKGFDRKMTEIPADSECIRYLFFPAFTIALILAMFFNYNTITPKQADILFVIVLGLAGMNIVVFYLIKNIVGREAQILENEILKNQIKEQTKMYRSISESFDSQKRKTHEYKNQIICIESMLGKKQYSELDAYVKNIYGNVNDEVDVINTNNVFVNAILNSKYQEATEKGMVFVFKVNDLSDLGMCDEDVVTVLANLLNNAIEACEKCTENKIIKLKFIKRDNEVIIAVKNTFNGIINYENGEIKTTKLFEAGEHGVGIKNIITIVEKYKGTYIIQESNKEFYFSIMIPLHNAV